MISTDVPGSTRHGNTTAHDRAFRILDPGDAHTLARVEMSDDGHTWRETPNYNRRALEHYRLHGSMPPGMDSSTWPAVKRRLDALLGNEAAHPRLV